MPKTIYKYEDIETESSKVEESVFIYSAIPIKKNFEEAAKECNAISVDSFFDELNERIRRRFNVLCHTLQY